MAGNRSGTGNQEYTAGKNMTSIGQPATAFPNLYMSKTDLLLSATAACVVGRDEGACITVTF